MQRCQQCGKEFPPVEEGPAQSLFAKRESVGELFGYPVFVGRFLCDDCHQKMSVQLSELKDMTDELLS